MPMIICIGQNFSTILMPTSGKSKYYSLGFALAHPFYMVKVYLTTLRDRAVLDFLTGMLDGFGISLKWSNSPMLFINTIIAMILIMVSGQDEDKLKLIDKVIIGLVAFMIVGVVYTSLCFTWTPEGAETVQGLQCRYFIPANLLIYLLFTNKKIKLNVKNKNLLYAIGMLVMYFLAFYTVSNGFY
jgi:uncharacterized membrane protein